MAAPRADDEQRLAAAARIELVIAVGQILRKLTVDGPLAAILERQVGAPRQRAIAAREQEAHRGWPAGLRRVGADAHGGAQRRVRLGRGGVLDAARVVVAIVDAEAIGRH